MGKTLAQSTELQPPHAPQGLHHPDIQQTLHASRQDPIARSARILVSRLPNNRPPPHVPTKREKSKRAGTRTPDGGSGRVQGIRLGRPQQHVGSTQESRKSMSQTFTCCSKGAKKTERAGKNRHRKWRTESNGRTRAKRPLGSLPLNTVLQLALDQHMQERKEKVFYDQFTGSSRTRQVNDGNLYMALRLKLCDKIPLELVSWKMEICTWL